MPLPTSTASSRTATLTPALASLHAMRNPPHDWPAPVATAGANPPAGKTPISHEGFLTLEKRLRQMSERIQRAAENGRMNFAQIREAEETLASIARHERSLRSRHGFLGPRAQAIIARRLDGLSQTLGMDTTEGF